MTTGFGNSEFTGDLDKCVHSVAFQYGVGDESNCFMFKKE